MKTFEHNFMGLFLFLLLNPTQGTSNQTHQPHHSFLNNIIINSLLKLRHFSLDLFNMDANFKTKNQQFRQQFRKKEVELFRKKIREEAMQSRMMADDCKELNDKVEQLIKFEDLNELYICLYRSKKTEKEVPMVHLTMNSINILLDYLMKNIHITESLLLLQNLFNLQYQAIFLNRSCLQRSRLIVRRLYQQADIFISESAERAHTNGNNINQLINAAILCIKSLIFNKEIANSQGYTFCEAVSEQYLVKYIFKWLQTLIQNPLYLITLVIVDYDRNISDIPMVRAYLNNSSSRIMIKLLQNSNPDNLLLKSCCLPSLLLANSFVKKISNHQILEQLLMPFLQTSKMVYAHTQKQQQTLFKFHTFYQITSSIVDIFRQLQDVALQKCLCEIMQQANYWTFASIILTCETYSSRQNFLHMIRLGLHNLLVCKRPLQQFLTQTIVGKLGEAIQSQVVDLILHSLHCFHSIYTYSQDNPQRSKEILNWIQTFDIETILQDLCYSSNKEVSELAVRLKEKKQRVDRQYRGDMESEPN